MKKLFWTGLLFLLCSPAYSQIPKHTFPSAKSDTSDATLVQASDWNDYHTFDVAGSSSVTDEFCGGLTTTGNIGDLNWSFTASTGTISQIAGIQYHGCVDSLSCGATANNYIAMYLSPSANIAPYVIGGSGNYEWVFDIRLDEDSTDQDYHVRFGLVDSAKADTIRPDNGIYIERLAGDDSLYGVIVNNNAAVTRTAGLAEARNIAWMRFTFRYVDSATDSVGFKLGNGTEVMITGANIPNTPDVLMPYIAVSNSNTASSNQVHIDFFSLNIKGLVR